MFKPKTTISAVFASPNGVIERDGRLENLSGEWIYTQKGYSVPPCVFDIIPLWEALL